MDCEELIKQLATEDDELASLAMKDLLARTDIEDVIAAYMDCGNELVRRRIHQLATIVDRRHELMANYRDVLSNEKRGLWDLGVVLNTIVDRQSTQVQINMLMEHLSQEYAYPVKNLAMFSKLLGEFGLRVSDVPERYLTDYLVNDAMLNNCGDETAVALVAMRLGAYCDWPLTLGLYRNIICLRDRMFNVIIPSNNWGVTHPLTKDFIPFDKHGFAIYMLGMMRNAATVDQLLTVVPKLDYLFHTTIALKK